MSKRFVRPCLETLEDRAVPAGLNFWNGGVSNDWATAGNWSLMRVPNATDDVFLSTLAAGASSPKIAAATNAVAGALHLDGANFNGTGLTIDGSLRTTGLGNAIGLAVDWQDKNVPISGAGRLNAEGNFRWGNGDISVANLYIYDTGTFYVTKDAKNLLSQNVYIGVDNAGAASVGKMVVSQGINQMNNNLTLGANTKIFNKAQGIIEFQNDTNSATQGGIAVGTNNNSITNDGLVWFSTADGMGQGLHVGVNIINNSAGSSLVFGQNLVKVNVHFNDPVGGGKSIGQIAGNTLVWGGSRIDLDDGMIVGSGTVKTSDAISQETWLAGDVTFTGGTLTVGTGDVAGSEQTLYVNGLNLLGATVEMAVDGRLTDAMDKIVANSPNVSVVGGTLSVKTIGGAGVAGNKWDIIQNTGGVAIGGTDFGAFNWTGMDLVGYNHGRNGTKYTLTKPVAAGGFGFLDTSKDGIRQVGESMLAGVVASIYDQYGTFIASQVTGSSGAYQFFVNPGTYYVTFTYNSSLMPHISAANQGTDDTVDSDVTSILFSDPHTIIGKTDNFTLTATNLDHLDVGLWY